MTVRLAPYGDIENAAILAKVGGPQKKKTPRNLAARMPSVEIAAKVGTVGIDHVATRRVVRRNAR